MKITSVEVQKKNLHRFNIFLDGKFAFGADEETIIKFRLLKGKEISSQELEEVLFEAEIGKLLAKVYNLLSFRARSEKEVRDFFKIKNSQYKFKKIDQISELAIDSLINRLKQKGLINDLEFAKTWVESRRRSKNKGINAIKSELFQKGIKREMIEEVFDFESSILSESQIAESALEKKINSWRSLDRNKLKVKAIQFLMRKGFDYDVSKEAIEKKLKKE